jgi:hypothetical protein
MAFYSVSSMEFLCFDFIRCSELSFPLVTPQPTARLWRLLLCCKVAYFRVTAFAFHVPRGPGWRTHVLSGRSWHGWHGMAWLGLPGRLIK